MPRRNRPVKIRAQYSNQLREVERNRRRARLNARKSHSAMRAAEIQR